MFLIVTKMFRLENLVAIRMNIQTLSYNLFTITSKLNCDELVSQTYWYKLNFLIILQSINTHATDWLSRWIWSLSMVHHRTASKKICLHVQHKYIRVSCNSFFQINIRFNNIWLQYRLSDLHFLTGIIIEDHDKDPVTKMIVHMEKELEDMFPY